MMVKIKLLYEDSIKPTKGTSQSAGYDLYAHLSEKAMIYPHETVMIKSGIAIEIPCGCFGGIYARSGISTRKGIRPANCTGVIDSDYRGEVGIPVHNDSNEIQFISNGDRIAQLIIQPYLIADLTGTDDLTDTARGSSGFGSTGK